MWVQWDDDVDFVVPERDRWKVLRSLRSVPGYSLTMYNQRLWKFWCSAPAPMCGGTLISAGDRYRFPFVDLFFYTRDDSRGLFLNSYTDKEVPLAHVFPLAKRPLGPLLLSVLCAMHTLRQWSQVNFLIASLHLRAE